MNIHKYNVNWDNWDHHRDIYSTNINTLKNNTQYYLLKTCYYPTEYIHNGAENNTWYINSFNNNYLGSGSFGDVYTVYSNDNQEYIAKNIRFKSCASTRMTMQIKQFKDNIEREVYLQLKAAEFGIALPILEAWYSDEYINKMPYNVKKIMSATLIMPKADYELLTYISEYKWSEKSINEAQMHVYRLVQNLHSLGIAHNDLNDRNIMYIKNTHQFVLIDFGLSTKFNKENFKEATEKDKEDLELIFDNIREIKETL